MKRQINTSRTVYEEGKAYTSISNQMNLLPKHPLITLGFKQDCYP